MASVLTAVVFANLNVLYDIFEIFIPDDALSDVSLVIVHFVRRVRYSIR